MPFFFFFFNGGSLEITSRFPNQVLPWHLLLLLLLSLLLLLLSTYRRYIMNCWLRLEALLNQLLIFLSIIDMRNKEKE